MDEFIKRLSADWSQKTSKAGPHVIKKGFSNNIEKETLRNKAYRKVLYTGENSQLVLMTLRPGEEIGFERHADVDQFFRVESGRGLAVVNDMKYELNNGSAVVVPSGAKHNIINTGSSYLKLYTIYSPPHHRDGIVANTKRQASGMKEFFRSKTTE